MVVVAIVERCVSSEQLRGEGKAWEGCGDRNGMVGWWWWGEWGVGSCREATKLALSLLAAPTILASSWWSTSRLSWLRFRSTAVVGAWMAPRVKSGQSARRTPAQLGSSRAERDHHHLDVTLARGSPILNAFTSDDRGSRTTEIARLDLECGCARRSARVKGGLGENCTDAHKHTPMPHCKK